MARIILIFSIFVALLSVQSCDCLKCYKQVCMKDDSGWECDHNSDGDVKEEEGVNFCQEGQVTENGKETMYIRQHGYLAKEEVEKLRSGKEACWTTKMEAPNSHVITCVCDKDLCNNQKWKLPEATKS